MEVIILGSGTGVPSARRGAPAAAVRTAAALVLIDLGSGSLRTLTTLGLDVNDLDLLCLTHLHPDHCGDLVPFLFATRYRLGYTRRHPFHLLAAAGFRRFLEHLQAAFPSWLEPPPGLLQIQELPADRPGEFAYADVHLRSAPVAHIPGSLAYRLTSGGVSVVFSGDTDWSPDLIELARGADLLVLEAANPVKVPGHLTPAEAGQLAAQAGVPRLVLTHFYPPCDQVDVAALAKAHYPGDLILAEDGLRLYLTAAQPRPEPPSVVH